MPPFASIINIPTTERLGVVSGLLNINNKSTLLIYPISLSVCLACSEDFLCKTKTTNSFIMVETWNPVLLPSNQELQFVDTISKDHIELYEKFLYSALLEIPFEEKKLFTGPPISSTSDIRTFFHSEERKSFELLLRPFNRLVTLISPVTM
ncbi:MAG: hypothetical protein JHC33_10895 [Ignisphaera sp.]|nr:hypothetical protein [Ignisphaera sp.]